MTKILSKLTTQSIDNRNYVMLHEPFGFRSDTLEKKGLKSEIWAQVGFVFDFESIPNWLRGPVGTNKRGGAAHDILSRKNICPGITKSIAATVYKEIMDYCDSIDIGRFSQTAHPFIPNPVVVPYVKVKDFFRRWIKSGVVRYWPGDYWQKWEMTATCMEIAGVAGDPYVSTEEKIEALIEKTEKVSEDLKDVNIVEAPAMVQKVDAVTQSLEDAKEVEEKK